LQDTGEIFDGPHLFTLDDRQDFPLGRQGPHVGAGIVSTYTKIFLYPTLEFAQCRMLWDDDLLRHGSRHNNGLRAASTEAGVQRRCDSSKG
jgi:hypothetical protein